MHHQNFQYYIFALFSGFQLISYIFVGILSNQYFSFDNQIATLLLVQSRLCEYILFHRFVEQNKINLLPLQIRQLTSIIDANINNLLYMIFL